MPTSTVTPEVLITEESRDDGSRHFRANGISFALAIPADRARTMWDVGVVIDNGASFAARVSNSDMHDFIGIVAKAVA